MKYSVVVKARNEEQNIEKTLLALKQQTLKPTQIIVVDDGSKDQTGVLASKLADLVVRLPDRGYSAVGRPELAQVINEGLARVKEDVDYVMICDSDQLIPEDYVETLVKKMVHNPRIVVASGRAKSEPFLDTHPRGTGRLVNAEFWRKTNGLRYPVEWGWESWLYFKAMQLGYEARSFEDIVIELQRPTSLTKTALWGKGMYALGYDWKFAIGRSALMFLRSPKAGLSMFLGWVRHKEVRRLDVADYVNQMQKQQLWKRIWAVVRGRKR